MACAACHTVFPELTPFGREFKLNGYVLDNMKQITGITTEARSTLALNQIPPISLMVQVAYTHTNTALPDSALAANGALARNGDLMFPQQASFFYAGKIADNFGAFVQMTYSGVGDHFSWDNTDIRYAKHFSVGDGAASKDLVFGVTLNDAPTVQDVWNSTVAWGSPYSGSATAPTPIAVPQLAGSLGQNAAGIGAYAWYDHSLYAEFSLYTAGLRGGAHPLDSTQGQVVHAAAPYWRLAYEYRWDRNSLMLGTYGLVVSKYPGAGLVLSGPSDKYRDVAADMQYQFISDVNQFTVLATYIDEKQTRNASFADGLSANPSDTLKALKLTALYYYDRSIGGSIGYFDTTGTSDALLYPSGPVSGSFTNSPDSNGEVLELNYLPWLNTKLQLQYTHYNKFNGGTTNYDVGAGPYPTGSAYTSGRRASDNDTLYLLAWLNF
ncbi:MAG: cytochrome C [Gammaproteobacteria bacterium]|nr:cytochrome C [Gammaproteobacteria bacterium]